MSSDLIEATERSLSHLEKKLETASEETLKALNAYNESAAGLEGLRAEVERTRAALAILRGEEAPSPAEPEQPKAESPRRKVRKPAGPFADMKCNGCGSVGTLTQGVESVGNQQVPVLRCAACNSYRPL